MKTLLQILTCLCLLANGAFAQLTFDLNPDYDAALGYHDGFGTSGQNYGTAIQNDAFCIPGASTGLNKNRALIHFDLSQFAPGTQVSSATLDLFALGPNGNLNGHTGTANAAHLKQVTSAWQEMVVTWDTQPTYSSSNFVSLAQSTSPTQDYLGTDVTAMVQAMIDDPQNNFGFGLMLQNEQVTNALTFCSQDHPDTNLHPVLHVTLCTDSLGLVADYDAAIGTHDGQNTSSNNYGTAPQNAAYCITASNGTPSGNINRALIHFDLSSIPNGATVNSAHLNLYARGQSGVLNGHVGTANQTYVMQVTDPWTDGAVTWNSQPNATTTNAVTLNQSSNPLQDYLNIDVTTIVNDWIVNGAPNYGFKLQLVTEVEYNGLLFQSLDCGDPTKFPRLDVSISCGKATAVAEEVKPKMTLYPNPAGRALQIAMELTKPGEVNVQILDINGRLVGTTNAGMQGTGAHVLSLDNLIDQAPAGMYIARVQVGETFLDQKLVLTGN